MSTAEKYIEIKQSGESPTGVTKIWTVENTRSRVTVGAIMWFGAFRKYCFFPAADMVFDASCQRMIADFLDDVNIKHKKK